LDNQPHNSADYVARAFIRWTSTDDVEGALADYSEAIRLDPTLAEAYTGRASAFYRQSDYNNALIDCTEATHLDPTLADAYRKRASVRDKLDDYEGALADFAAAIRLEPDNDSDFYCRGGLRQKYNDYEGALTDFTAAIRLKPSDYNYDYRADVYIAIGNFDKAIEDFKKALENDSDSDPWWGWYDKIGTAYAAKGDFIHAIEAYKQALILNPTDLQRLKAIQEFLSTQN